MIEAKTLVRNLLGSLDFGVAKKPPGRAKCTFSVDTVRFGCSDGFGVYIPCKLLRCTVSAWTTNIVLANLQSQGLRCGCSGRNRISGAGWIPSSPPAWPSLAFNHVLKSLRGEWGFPEQPNVSTRYFQSRLIFVAKERISSYGGRIHGKPQPYQFNFYLILDFFSILLEIFANAEH
jgi:hypothetical protein